MINGSEAGKKYNESTNVGRDNPTNRKTKVNYPEMELET